MRIIDNRLVKELHHEPGGQGSRIAFDHLKRLLAVPSQVTIVSPYFGADLLGDTELFVLFSAFFRSGGTIRLLINEEVSGGSSPFKTSLVDTQSLASWVQQIERAKQLLRVWGNSGEKHFLIRRAPGFCHAKAYVARRPEPGSEEFFVVMGSSNFTWSGLHREGELCVQISDQEHAKEVWKWADYIWEHLSEPSPDLETQLTHFIGLNHFSLVNDVAFRILAEDRFQRPGVDFGTNTDIQAVPKLLREGMENFQKEGALRALDILNRHGIVLIADPTGFGKTWEGAATFFAELSKSHAGRGAIICPASAVDRPWKHHLKEWRNRLEIPIISHEQLSRLGSYPELEDPDLKVILIDEAHRFRSGDAATGAGTVSNRFEILQTILSKRVDRPKIILLSATPISNSVWDLANMLSLGTGRNLVSQTFENEYRQPLRNMFSEAMRHPTVLENVMEAFSVRRTRTTLLSSGVTRSFPDRHFAHNRAYASDQLLLDLIELVDRIRFTENLPRGGALVRTNLLKSLESSKAALGVWALKQLIRLGHKEFANSKLLAKIPDRFRSEILDLDSIDVEEEDETTAIVSRDDVDTLKKIVHIIENSVSQASIDPKVIVLTEIVRAEVNRQIVDSPESDPRIVVFAFSRPTVFFLANALRETLKNGPFELEVFAITGMLADSDREKISAVFRPAALSTDDPKNRKIKILISTDVFAEGQDLHAASCVISYDVPWSPARIVQRSGRVDRVGSPYEEVHSYILRPPEALNERFYRFVQALEEQADDANAGGLVSGLERKARIMRGAGILNINIFTVEKYEADYFQKPTYDLRSLEEQLMSDPRTEQHEVLQKHIEKLGIPDMKSVDSALLDGRNLELIRNKFATPVLAVDHKGIMGQECVAFFAFFEGKRLPAAGKGLPLRITWMDDKRKWHSSMMLDGQKISWLYSWWISTSEEAPERTATSEMDAVCELAKNAHRRILEDMNADAGVNLFSWQEKEKNTLRNALQLSEEANMKIVRAFSRWMIGKTRDESAAFRKRISESAETSASNCYKMLEQSGAALSDDSEQVDLLTENDLVLIGGIVSAALFKDSN